MEDTESVRCFGFLTISGSIALNSLTRDPKKYGGRGMPVTVSPSVFFDELRRVLKEALDQTGCDGDLCLHQWHEDARKVLSRTESP